MDPFGILSALIAPTVLVAATAQLVTSTSHRVAGVVEQLRSWSDEYGALQRAALEHELLEARLELMFELIGLSTRRARYLQSVLMVCYVSLALFVATGLAVAGSALLAEFGWWWGWYVWVPVVLGLGGACTLFGACLLLMREAALAMQQTIAETRYLMHWRERATRDGDIPAPQFQPRVVGR
jgi:hypothetical protein